MFHFPILMTSDLRFSAEISKSSIFQERALRMYPPLKNLPQLDSLSMWNLWLDRGQTDELGGNLPNLRIIDYQWGLYEKDSIGRVLPKLRVKLN